MVGRKKQTELANLNFTRLAASEKRDDGPSVPTSSHPAYTPPSSTYHSLYRGDDAQNGYPLDGRPEKDFSDSDLLLDATQMRFLRKKTCCWIDITAVSERWRKMPSGQKRNTIIALVSIVLVTAIVLITIPAAAEVRKVESPAPQAAPPPSRVAAAPSPPSSSAHNPTNRPPPPPRSSRQPAFIPTSTPPLSLVPPPPALPALQPPPRPPFPPPFPVDALCSYPEDAMYLPEVVLPKEYDIHWDLPLNPDAGADWTGVVQGRVDIQVEVRQATLCVVLHADKSLVITSVKAKIPGSDSAMEGTVASRHGPMQHVVLKWLSALPATQPSQPIVLSITYMVPLGPGLDGLYTSSYKDAAGKSHTLATTQFEAIAARKALPCFDEPRLKAYFKLSVTVPSANITALSNTPVQSTEVLQDGRVVYTFERSPLMSTYLLALVAGHLVGSTAVCVVPDTEPGVEEVQDRLVPIGVWATPGKEGLLSTALRAACTSVQAFSMAFQVHYPLAKLDLVGLPSFAAGAMENWGLITYRETALLVDPAEDDIQSEYYISTVVAHEISHQWFGNLVTMRDWNELWLNEGFASYFENLGAAAIKPAYGYFNQFYTDETSAALSYDTLNTSHPLSSTAPMTKLADIDNYFDPISYEKGGAVLRMLRAYLNSATLPLGTDFNLRRRSRSRRSRHLAAALTRALLQDDTTTDIDSALKEASSVQAPDGPMSPLTPGEPLLPPPPSPGTPPDAPPEPPEDKSHPPVTPDYPSSPPPLQPPAMPPPSPPRMDVEPNMSTNLLYQSANDVLLQGLTHYLQTHQYGSVTAQDLWTSLSITTAQPIDQWMRGWTYNKNYPVVSVVLLGPDDPANPKPSEGWALSVSQASVTGAACDMATQANLWWIPLSCATAGGHQMMWHEVSSCSAAVSLEHSTSSKPDWVLVNPGRFGFYRTNYTEEMWEMLSQVADNPEALPPVDLAGLLDDAYRLSESSGLAPNVFLDLTMGLGQRLLPEYAPWIAALSGLHAMQRILDTAALTDRSAWSACSKRMAVYTRELLLVPILQSLELPVGSFQNNAAPIQYGVNLTVQSAEPLQLRLLRPPLLMAMGMAIRALGDANAPAVQQQLIAQAESLLAMELDMSTEATIQADVRGAVYSINIMAGDSLAYTNIRRLYEQETDATEAARLLHALTEARDARLITRTLAYAADPKVKLQDMGVLVQQVGLRGGVAFKLTWDYLFAHTQDLLDRYGTGGASSASYSLGRRLLSLAKGFTDDSRMEDLTAWATQYSEMLDSSFMDVVHASIQRHQTWLSGPAVAVCAWLEGNVP